MSFDVVDDARSRLRGPYGFVRGARGNSCPYRDPARGGLSAFAQPERIG